MAKIIKNHSLGREKAKAKIETMLPSFAEKYNVKYKWADEYTVLFEGSGAKGRFVITDNTIEGELSLGLLLRPLEGKITSAIQEKLDEVLI